MDNKSKAETSQDRWMPWAMVTIAGVFLANESPTYVLSVLPYLMLAACPLVHPFMPHDHGDHQQRTNSKHTWQVRSTNHEPY